MCDFRQGDEVVCVDASLKEAAIYEANGYRWIGNMPPQGICEGETYTVAGVGIGYRGKPVVWLYEAKNPNDQGLDIGYRPNRFRKVIRKDMSEWLSSSVGNTDHLDKRKKEKV